MKPLKINKNFNNFNSKNLYCLRSYSFILLSTNNAGVFVYRLCVLLPQ